MSGFEIVLAVHQRTTTVVQASRREDEKGKDDDNEGNKITRIRRGTTTAGAQWAPMTTGTATMQETGRTPGGRRRGDGRIKTQRRTGQETTAHEEGMHKIWCLRDSVNRPTKYNLGLSDRPRQSLGPQPEAPVFRGIMKVAWTWRVQ